MTPRAYAYLRNEQTKRTSAQYRRVARQVGQAIRRLERRNKNAAGGNQRQGQSR